MKANYCAALARSVVLAAIVVLVPGCVTVEPGAPQALQTAMAADHQATLAVLQAVNTDAAPYLVQLGLAPSKQTFTEADLYLVDPKDIAAWDQILGGLDAYCAALTALASGKSSSDFVAATEGLAGSVQALGKSVKSDTQPYTAVGGTALAGIGSLLIQHQADAGLQRIARAADPDFQRIVQTLVAALGFEGSPPGQPAAHGLCAAYSRVFDTATAASRKEFKNGEIAGFAGMTAAQRADAIHALAAWLAAGQAHARVVASLTDLAVALDKAGRAHAALATGSDADVAREFAALKAQVATIVTIYQTLKKQ